LFTTTFVTVGLAGVVGGLGAQHGGGAVTATVAVALGCELGSRLLAVAVTVSSKEPVEAAAATIVSDAEVPFGTVPIVQVIEVVPEQLPPGADAETKVSPDGSVSLTATSVASAGPWLATTIPKVTFEPGVNEVGLGVFEIVSVAS
jgi:hypothetical protein